MTMHDKTKSQKSASLPGSIEVVKGIEEGLASMDAGEGEGAEVVFARLERKYPFLTTP